MWIYTSEEQLAWVSSLGKGKESAKEISCIISNNNVMRKSIKIPISEMKKTNSHFLVGFVFRKGYDINLSVHQCFILSKHSKCRGESCGVWVPSMASVYI